MRISDWSSDVCSSDLTFDRRSRRDMADGPAMPRFAPQAVVGAAVAHIVERRIGTDACTDGGQLGGSFQIGAAARCDYRVRKRQMIGDTADVPPMACAREDHGAAFGSGLLDEMEHLRPVRQSRGVDRSEEHTSELQSLMRISYAV